MRGGEEQRRGPALPTHTRSRSQGRGGIATLSTDTFRATVPQHVTRRAGCVWTPRHAANSRRRTPSRGKRRGTGRPEGLRPGDTGRGDTGPVRTRTLHQHGAARKSPRGTERAGGRGAALGGGPGAGPWTQPAHTSCGARDRGARADGRRAGRQRERRQGHSGLCTLGTGGRPAGNVSREGTCHSGRLRAPAGAMACTAAPPPGTEKG